MFLFCSNIPAGTYREYPTILAMPQTVSRAAPQRAAHTALTAARNRAAVMEELRRMLPGVSDLRKALPLGLATLDSCLPEGGLPCGALHEIVPAPYSIPAAIGFIAAILGRLFSFVTHDQSIPPLRERSTARSAVWRGLIVDLSKDTPLPNPPPQGGRERAEFAGAHSNKPLQQSIVFVLPTYGLGPYGRLHGHGLRTLGLDPARLILVETAHRRDTLWAIEEAARSRAPAAITGFIDKLDLKTSQRLQLAAAEAGRPLFLLRPAQNLESSAAATRWRVGAAEAARDRFGLITRPRWHLKLERARNGRPGEWVVEYDHVAHRFSLAAALADPARARGTSKEPIPTTETYCA
jgi:protein ImuA